MIKLSVKPNIKFVKSHLLDIFAMNRIVLVCFCLAIGVFDVSAQGSAPDYKNENLPIDKRIDDLISRMTLEEKANQLFNGAPAIPRLGVPAYNWWNECLHGVARAGKATVFPQAIGLAATFDEQLMLRLGDAISDEARAKHHYFVKNNARSIYMGLTFWTPNINIFRDPRWGRGQETYGEDPFLTGRIAINFIKGLQGNDPKYLKTIATAKHYAVHSGPEFTRHSDNIFINDRDLHETYLPAFRATVKEAHVQSVMCAYNRFRDKPCCGSDLLLTSILRDDFGFDGYIVSDCGAITDFYNTKAHNLVETPSRAWGWSLGAGTDLNCEEAKAFITNLDSAVNAGIINEADINRSLKRLFRARFRLGMFDSEDKQPFARIPMSVVGSPKHQALTLEAAQKSLVLLKNDGILPLSGRKKIALIGPNANNEAVLTANYNGDPINPVTPLVAFRQRVGKNLEYSVGSQLVPGVYTDLEIVSKDVLFHIDGGSLKKGLIGSYYHDTGFSGTAAIVRVDPHVNFSWERSPINGVVDEPFAVRWNGILIPAKTATYIFGGNVSVSIDGKPVKGQVKLHKGVRYEIVSELVVKDFWWANNHQQQFASLRWTETSRDYRREALEIAGRSDVIIFCGGISANLEGEEMPLQTDGFAHGDRTHIDLPSIQEDLLKELNALGKPIIYVNFSGSAVALNWEAENLSAVVQAFYPGEAAGTALANLIYGDYSPSGRLPITFYKSIDDIPAFKDYRMEGKTYRYFKGTPLFEFGYGLSYTNFNYMSVNGPDKISAGDSAIIEVQLTNTGKKDSEEVVQVYLRADNASVPVPLRSLVAFKRIFLKSGETKRLHLTIKPEAFSVIDNRFERSIEPGVFTLFVGGKQPDQESISKGLIKELRVSVTGKSVTIQE